MDFAQHITEIDRRVEERKEEQDQRALFDLGGDATNEAGLAMGESIHRFQQCGDDIIVHSYTLP